jgi:DNA-binding MarR family transcriptional regulator
MQENERNKLVELTKKAVTINEELLANEKKFIEEVSSGGKDSSLEELNEKLNELCSKELLYLAATKSLLQIINKK